MRILVLGTGNAQTDLIKYCKEAGHAVYGCSYYEWDSGNPFLDGFKQVNIVDVDGVAAYAKEIQADVVYSIGSDIAMPTASAVSEKLGLPTFINERTAILCNNKYLMRSTLGQDFVGNVPFVSGSIIDEVKKFTDFPAIMKPVDSQGQRGVVTVSNLSDIQTHFEECKGHSKSGEVILEKLIDGSEISVNCFIENGSIVFALASDRISFDEFPGGIIKEHHVPSKFSADLILSERILSLVQRVASRLKIHNGPAYFQIMIENGVPYIVEVTPRLDGCHMWRLIRTATGVDLLDLTVRYLTDPYSPPVINSYSTRQGLLKFMCQESGSIVSHAQHQIPNNPDYQQWYQEDGEQIRQLNGFMEKCGYWVKCG